MDGHDMDQGRYIKCTDSMDGYNGSLMISLLRNVDKSHSMTSIGSEQNNNSIHEHWHSLGHMLDRCTTTAHQFTEDVRSKPPVAEPPLDARYIQNK